MVIQSCAGLPGTGTWQGITRLSTRTSVQAGASRLRGTCRAQHAMRSDFKLLCAPSLKPDRAVLLQWEFAELLLCATCHLAATTRGEMATREDVVPSLQKQVMCHMLLPHHISWQPLAAVVVLLRKLSAQSSLARCKGRDLSLSLRASLIIPVQWHTAFSCSIVGALGLC
jgi:hypothetical protein